MLFVSEWSMKLDFVLNFEVLLKGKCFVEKSVSSVELIFVLFFLVQNPNITSVFTGSKLWKVRGKESVLFMYLFKKLVLIQIIC